MTLRLRTLGPLAIATALAACGDDSDAPEAPPAAAETSEAASADEGNVDDQAEVPAAANAPATQSDDEALSDERLREVAQTMFGDPAPLVVGHLLTRSDIRALTSFDGTLNERTLEGQAPGPDYNAIRVEANGGYGFGLQVWRGDSPRDLHRRYERLRTTYFLAEIDRSGPGESNFSGNFQGIRQYGFTHPASLSVAVVSCADTLCDDTQIRQLAGRVFDRF